MSNKVPFSLLSDSEFGDLLRAAGEARLNAYAPYSRFMVGTAILTCDGRIFAGCNVESADFDGTHAEESALATMVAAGTRSPRAYLTVGGKEDESSTLIASCGKCRQKFKEFASLSGTDPVIVMPANVRLVFLSQLLPDAFGPANLLSEADLAKYRRP